MPSGVHLRITKLSGREIFPERHIVTFVGTNKNQCFFLHSWIVTKTLPTSMKMDETSTTRSTCSYKFKLDPAGLASSPLRL